MLKKFCVLTNSATVKELEDLINKYYQPKSYRCIVEPHIDDILSSIKREKIKDAVKELWFNLEHAVGYKIALVFNTIQNEYTTLRLNASLIIRISAEDKNICTFESIQKNTGIIIKIRDVQEKYIH